MFASTKKASTQVRPLIRPMPIAYALSTDRTTAPRATDPLMSTELTSFWPKSTRSQKSFRPSR